MAALRLSSCGLSHRGSAQMVATGLIVLMLQTLTEHLGGVLAAPATNRDRVVYWNASNPLFQAVGENVLIVSLQDRINIVCPNSGVEYYQIYWTPNSEHVKACSGGNFLFDCRTMDSYLVYVQIFPADPTAPGFLNPVYFYTPSRGDLLGLELTSGGACQLRNMRVTVRTGDSSTTSKSEAVSSDTTTSRSSWTDSVSRLQPAYPTATTTSDRQASAGSPIATKSTTITNATTVTTSGSKESANTGNNWRTTSTTAAGEPERVDYARINLITGSAVAMPTAVAVFALTCISVSAARMLAL